MEELVRAAQGLLHQITLLRYLCLAIHAHSVDRSVASTYAVTLDVMSVKL